MLSRGHHTAIFIISMFMLLVKFIVTYTLKDKLTTWLCVNTKIGTGKRLTCGPNLAEEYHSTEVFSQKRSVEASTVRSTTSFGRRTFPWVEAKSIRECMMTWIEYKERDELMTGTRQT
jgi:hypothetical protein